MATLLYRLGQFAYRRAWTVISIWLVLLVAVGSIAGVSFATGAAKFSDSFTIPGTDSQDALDRLSAVFPQTGHASIQVVYTAEDGSPIEEHRADIEALAADLEDIPNVDTVQAPWDDYTFASLSDDGDVAITTVALDGAAADIPDSSVDAILATADDAAADGLVAQFGGQILQTPNIALSIIELFGVIFAGVVLVISFGSLLAAGMPLLGALVGVGIALSGIVAAAAFTDMSSTAPMLALMIGLAVGIDYALFILMRHRTQLAQGIPPEESAARAVGTAGSAVVFAGVTVIVALLGLLVVGIPFLSVMGVGAAVAVLVGIAVAVTLLPALLGLAKGRLTPKAGSRAERRANAEESGARSMGRRWVGLVVRAPWAFIVGVVVLLGVVAIPAASLSLALPDAGQLPESNTARQSYDTIEEHFGTGYTAPLIVAADITQTTDILDDLDGIKADLEKLPGVEAVSDGLPNPTIDTAVFRVIPTAGAESATTQQLVADIRALNDQLVADYDVSVSVTGTTAVMIDISQRLADALVPFGVVVVGLSVILLLLVFRSIWVPIKAALGFLLTVVASFGVVVAVFQWGWGAELIHAVPGPILSFMPIIVMAVLFGLAMDYEVFLVSGMREAWVHGGNAKQAVVDGFSHAARVVTGAALIMIFIFGAFVPEGSSEIKVIALALAAGVLFDAFLVRMTLVPAVMAVLGRHAWWLPKGLARILPNVDIEGDTLKGHREAVAWAESREGAVVAEALELPGGIAPLDFSIESGTTAVLTGDGAARRVLAATLAGRLTPVAGRVQVVGAPLPSEAARVSARVALVELDAATPVGTVGERIRDHARLGRGGGARARAREAQDRLERAVRLWDGSRVAPGALVAELPAVPRLLALTAAAVAEGPELVVVDLPDQPLPDADAARLVQALGRLVPAPLTLVVGAPAPIRVTAADAARPHTTVTVDRAAAPAGAVR